MPSISPAEAPVPQMPIRSSVRYVEGESVNFVRVVGARLDCNLVSTIITYTSASAVQCHLSLEGCHISQLAGVCAPESNITGLFVVGSTIEAHALDALAESLLTCSHPRGGLGHLSLEYCTFPVCDGAEADDRVQRFARSLASSSVSDLRLSELNFSRAQWEGLVLCIGDMVNLSHLLIGQQNLTTQLLSLLLETPQRGCDLQWLSIPPSCYVAELGQSKPLATAAKDISHIGSVLASCARKVRFIDVMDPSLLTPSQVLEFLRATRYYPFLNALGTGMLPLPEGTSESIKAYNLRRETVARWFDYIIYAADRDPQLLKGSFFAAMPAELLRKISDYM